VNSWYERYLRRAPDRGAATWVQSLRRGHSPEEVLSTILSSEEYFARAGGSNVAFVRQLIGDLVGREPAPVEVSYWAGRLRFDSRRDVAYRLLILHPRDWSGTNPPPPAYDPGYYPDPASLRFRDPSGPYFKSPYFYNYEYRRPIRAFSLGAQG
jgi:hypothetical protein